MSHVGILEPETHRTNESLMFWRLSGEVLTNEANFVDSPFPAFSLAFSRADDLEHLCFSHRLDLLDGDSPLACLFLSLLFDHVGEYFGVPLLLSVHEIGGDCAFLDVLHSALGVLLFVLFDSLLHLYLLLEPLLVEELGLDTLQGLCLLGDDLGLSGLFLPALLLRVQPFSESFLMQVNEIILRHCV